LVNAETLVFYLMRYVKESRLIHVSRFVN
jgi:hypothetical protein